MARASARSTPASRSAASARKGTPRAPGATAVAPPAGLGAADAGFAALAVAAALFVFRGALPYFFAQDDFTGLARAHGLLPALHGPWRWISGQLYFEVMARLAGLHPFPYHLASLAAHGVTVALVYVACRRFVSPLAALLGAVWFGTHPSLYTALYSVSGIGEILSGLLAVGTLLLVTRSGRERSLAVPCFVAALMCKESIVLLPVLLVARAAGEDSRDEPLGASRVVLPVTLLVLSVLYIAAFLLGDTFGVRGATDAAAPYALRLDLNLLDNLLTYWGWTIRIAAPWVHSFSDVVDPSAYEDGIALAAVWLIGCAVKDLRKRGWVGGGFLYLLFLLPVLPLGNHTYHYYLYAPLAGAAWCVAALADTLWARLGAGRTGTVILGVVALALVVNAAFLVHKIETYPFIDRELRSDPTVDRARIAGNAVADLQKTRVPDATTLVFWSPASIDRQRTAGADTTHTSYWETNVRDALYGGLAVRLFVPAVREVRFERSFTARGDSVWYALYEPNGHLRMTDSARLEAFLKTQFGGTGP